MSTNQANRNGSPHSIQEPFNRPPRITLTMQSETLVIPPPPAKEDVPDWPNMWMLLIPIMMVLMMCVVYFGVNHWSMTQAASLLPIGVVSVVSPIATIMTSLQKEARCKRRTIQIPSGIPNCLQK